MFLLWGHWPCVSPGVTVCKLSDRDTIRKRTFFGTLSQRVGILRAASLHLKSRPMINTICFPMRLIEGGEWKSGVITWPKFRMIFLVVAF
jgi:hypothetical protein